MQAFDPPFCHGEANDAAFDVLLGNVDEDGAETLFAKHRLERSACGLDVIDGLVGAEKRVDGAFDVAGIRGRVALDLELPDIEARCPGGRFGRRRTRVRPTGCRKHERNDQPRERVARSCARDGARVAEFVTRVEVIHSNGDRIAQRKGCAAGRQKGPALADRSLRLLTGRAKSVPCPSRGRRT